MTSPRRVRQQPRRQPQCDARPPRGEQERRVPSADAALRNDAARRQEGRVQAAGEAQLAHRAALRAPGVRRATGPSGILWPWFSRRPSRRRRTASFGPGFRDKTAFASAAKIIETGNRRCLEVIEVALEESAGLNEYPLYVKALITRQRGNIQDALELFQAATCLNPSNVRNLKQVGHSLYLLGKHKAALGVYEQARAMADDLRTSGRPDDGEGRKRRDGEDWELWHNAGLCHVFLKQYDAAIEAFERANAAGRHDATFLQLGRVHELRGDARAALRVYQDALDVSPENSELLTTVGLARRGRAVRPGVAASFKRTAVQRCKSTIRNPVLRLSEVVPPPAGTSDWTNTSARSII